MSQRVFESRKDMRCNLNFVFRSLLLVFIIMNTILLKVCPHRRSSIKDRLFKSCCSNLNLCELDIMVYQKLHIHLLKWSEVSHVYHGLT